MKAGCGSERELKVMTRDDLFKYLEEATEDEQKDALNAVFLFAVKNGWIEDFPCYKARQFISIGAYESAALTLVPEGLCWRYDSALGYAEIFDLSKSPIHVAGSSDDPCLNGKPPALALCIAALKAHQGESR
jgi:hypothetical protein